MRSMKYLRCAAAGGAVAIAAAGLAARSHADSIPPGWEANNMEPIGYSALDNRKGAFKMAIKKVNGHWYLYMGHLWHYGWKHRGRNRSKGSEIRENHPGSKKYLDHPDDSPRQHHGNRA